MILACDRQDDHFLCIYTKLPTLVCHRKIPQTFRTAGKFHLLENLWQSDNIWCRPCHINNVKILWQFGNFIWNFLAVLVSFVRDLIVHDLKVYEYFSLFSHKNSLSCFIFAKPLILHGSFVKFTVVFVAAKLLLLKNKFLFCKIYYVSCPSARCSLLDSRLILLDTCTVMLHSSILTVVEFL